MNSNTKKFIVLLGGDGAGKTSVIKNLGLDCCSVISYSETPVSNRIESMCEIEKIVRKDLLPQFSTMSPQFRVAVYNLFVAYMAESISHEICRNNVICDSYYYKFMAKEILSGVDANQLQIWKTLQRPDAVVYLDADPRLAYRRIKKTRAIQSNEKFVDDREEEGFIRLQKRLKEQMIEIIRKSNIPLSLVDANKPLKDVCLQVQNNIIEILK
ncbi:MAG: hypothetical protein QY312_03205 [Candidatus Dojkabacteria bacterium]|nr:MAG: hypothetical protein QY312_03205 [Candidatus Dojkabacteria bacterium]